MYSRIINNEIHYYICIPKEYVMNRIKDFDPYLSDEFFTVYCALEKWRNPQWLWRGTFRSLYEDCGGKNLSKNRLSANAKKILYVLEYMEREHFISVVKGDYHNLDNILIIKLNTEKFVTKSFNAIDLNHFDYIIRNKGSVRKGTLLHILFYIFSIHIPLKIIDKETGEITEGWYHVFSESFNKMKENTGISINTIRTGISLLSDSTDNTDKPLIIRQHPGVILRNGKKKSFPNIYLENAYGWRECLKYELNYYDNLAKQMRGNIDNF